MQGVDVARLDINHFLAAETWQDDPVEHGSVILDASRALLRDRMLFEVVRCQLLHSRSGTDGSPIGDWIVPLEGIRQDDPCLLSSLVKGEQRPVLTDGLAP